MRASSEGTRLRASIINKMQDLDLNAKFNEGVRCIVYNWTEVNFAVAQGVNSWNGVKSSDVR